MSQSCDFRFLPVTKDPDESRQVELDLFPLCANFWRANEQRALNEQIRPRQPTGFAYQANGDGTSGGREPAWPRTLGATVPDGSLVWTAIGAGSNGVNPISAPDGTADPPGALAISGVVASESTRILATYTGGVDQQNYDAVFTFMLQGLQRVGRQRVKVCKR